MKRPCDAGVGCCRCSGSISSVYPLRRVTGPRRCGAKEEAAVSISSSDALQSSLRVLLHVSVLGAVNDTCFARAASLCRIVNPVDRLAGPGDIHLQPSSRGKPGSAITVGDWFTFVRCVLPKQC